MAILKCKMCGAPLNPTAGATVVECEYCESRQTLPGINDEKKLALYNSANSFRSNKEFDNAAAVYANILADLPNEAEANWGICLCRYGIEYVQDPKSGKRVPTCHKTQFKSILDDPNYLAAVRNADIFARDLYTQEAKYIDSVQKEIHAISSQEDPYDIFICYKESDPFGGRTPDSVMAQEIYNRLTDIGYRVFFARITLEDKLGSAYEPYIFSALSSAKIMLAFGTKPEYFKAEWVKNEWDRYLAFAKQDPQKRLIPCYKDISPYEMPEEFSSLQSQDMGKLGWEQDLVRGIEKILPLEKESSKETVIIQQGAATATTHSLLKRMFIYLEDGDWENADAYSERVLDIEPENAMAYLGKLMAELKVGKEERLKNCDSPFDRLSSFQKAYRYGDTSLKRKLDGAITHIKERNKTADQERIYSSACEQLRSARKMPIGQKNSRINSNCGNAYDQFMRIQNFKDSKALMEECRELMYSHACAVQASAAGDEDFQHAADLFHGIPGYQTFKDSLPRANECFNKAAALRQERLYNSARQSEQAGDLTSLRDAIRLYSNIGNYKDAPQRLQNCQNKLSKLEAEQNRKQEIERKKSEKQEKKDAKKKKRGGCGGCLWKLIKFYFIFGIIMAVLAGVISLFVDNDDDSSGTLESLTITADRTECNIGEAIVLSISSSPKNPENVINGNDSTIYFSTSNIRIYLREGENATEVGNGASLTYEFESSGEYVFFAKYCPHSWDCDPAYDIVSEDITVNVNGNPISTIEELQALSNSDGDYQLTGDLDLGGIEWTPIENFTGKFSGGGHTIYNLTINSDAEHIGFFGVLSGDVRDIVFDRVTINAGGRPESVGTVAGTVKGSVTNVRVEVGTVNAPKGTNVGGIAGLVTELPKYAAFKNLHGKVTVTGSTRVGGLFGAIESSSAADPSTVLVQDCHNFGEISGKESVGGLFGYIQLDDTGIDWGHNDYKALMDDLSNTGSVSGDTQVGGIVGYAKTNTHDSYLKNAESTGSITAKAYAGCIAGKLEYLTVDGCSNAGSLTASGSVTVDGEDETYAYVGGIVGYGSVVTNCTNTVDIDYAGDGSYVGGIAGYVCDLPENAVMENNRNHASVKGANCVGGLFGSIYSKTDSHHTLTMQNSSNEGEISGKNSVGGLMGELYLDNTWTSAFSENNSYTAQLSDLSNTGAVSGELYVGGIIGDGVTDSRSSYLKDSQNSAPINAKAYVGCIAGNLDLIALDNCSNEGSSLTATGYVTYVSDNSVKYAYVGGYVGRGYTVNRCTNTVDIEYKSSGRYVGGIAGCLSGFTLSETTMENLQNKANITGASYTGGLIGEIKITQNVTELKFTLLDFSNEGNISGDDYVGGLIGQLYLDDDNKYVDNVYEAAMDAMSNTGKVSGKNYVGGILGYGKTTSIKSVMTDITANGAVSGNSNYNQVNGKVENITVE